ncbi:mannitol dehydrogenase family protein, partial [Xanthomonas oryzae pv. oryzae]
SCDNLTDNGTLLERSVVRLAEQTDPALAEWIAQHATFPRSMVDSITPATDDALRMRVQDQLGVHDAWPIQRERYSQWVIEDRFCNGRPAFERAGVTLSEDLAGYARAKLRLLNAPHSALAYLGSLLQLETVADAMRHSELAAFVETSMRAEIAPTLQSMEGFDAQRYSNAILARFRNPAIRHRLAQIAWDGSQKIPVRLLGTIGDALAAGQPMQRLCLAVAAWLHFIRRQAHEGVPLVDPLNDALSALGRTTTGDARHDVAAFLTLDAVFGSLSADMRFSACVQTAYAALGTGTPTDVTQALGSMRDV